MGTGLPESIGASFAGDKNRTICLIGDGKYTRQQFKSLDYYIHGILQTYEHIKPWNIYTHNEFPSAIKQGKTCPVMRSGVLMYWYTTKDLKSVADYLLE